MSAEETATADNQEQENDIINRYLEFSLGDEHYAIPLLNVREVIAVPKTTPIPNTPAYFEGIMNLRGQVISILDIRKKLGIKPEGTEEEHAVIIVDLDPVFMGVIVDSVNKVLPISQKNIGEKPNVEGAKSDYITGVYRSEERLTILMDISKTLNVGDIKKLQQSAA